MTELAMESHLFLDLVFCFVLLYLMRPNPKAQFPEKGVETQAAPNSKKIGMPVRLPIPILQMTVGNEEGHKKPAKRSGNAKDCGRQIYDAVIIRPAQALPVQQFNLPRRPSYKLLRF